MELGANASGRRDGEGEGAGRSRRAEQRCRAIAVVHKSDAAGQSPVLVRLAVGVPVVVTRNVPGCPVTKVAILASVNAGGPGVNVSTVANATGWALPNVQVPE